MTAILFVPAGLSDQLNTTLTIEYGSSPNPGPLGSIILNITLVDSQGNLITILDSPLTICLPRLNTTKKEDNVCLGYLDEANGEWKCEDTCPENKKNRFVCGQTDHLTNFALLLLGNLENGNPCESQARNSTISWISLGLVAAAVVYVAIGVLCIEVYYRRHSKSRTSMEGEFPLFSDEEAND